MYVFILLHSLIMSIKGMRMCISKEIALTVVQDFPFPSLFFLSSP